MGCLIRSLLVLVLVAAFAYLVLLILGNESGSSAEFEVSTGFEMAGRGEVVVAPTETPVLTEAHTPTSAPTSIASISIATATPLPTWTPIPPWPSGGTLHQASLDEWFRATDANRLATAAGWIVAADEQAAFNTDNLYVEADALVTCIRDTAPTTPATWQVPELATACLASMTQHSEVGTGMSAPQRMPSNMTLAAATGTSTPAGWHKQINGVDFWSGCPCDQGNMLKCDDFGGDYTGRWNAQACFERCEDLGFDDPHDLDRDNDGDACEWSW